MLETFTADDGLTRCNWCRATDAYTAYHDSEWGFPVTDDRRLFEKICLEGFQSGLSWLTILNKRDNFRAAFDGFDFNRVADYGAADVDRLLGDTGIVRHRGKIEAAINNAARAQELVAETGTLAAYFWQFEPAPAPDSGRTLAATTAESVTLSKDLKKRGWKFVGPTTVYAFMQAMGLVNDHALDCALRAKVENAKATFTRPRP